MIRHDSNEESTDEDRKGSGNAMKTNAEDRGEVIGSSIMQFLHSSKP
jgi:hypothetical protein